MVLQISNQLQKAYKFPFGDGYTLVRSEIPNCYFLSGLGLGLEILRFDGLGLGWARSPWARAGLGRGLAGPWRTLLPNATPDEMNSFVNVGPRVAADLADI